MNEEFIIRLIDTFSAGNAAELELQEGSLRIVLRKESRSGAAGVEHIPSPPSGNAAAGNKAPGLPGGAGVNAEKTGADRITSPIVATFYASPGPDTPALVARGSRVKKGDTLCILEAMKMMNHLEAEFDCEILDVKAKNGDMVEFGQVLFDVRRL